MGIMTKWPVQNRTEHHKTRSIQRRYRHQELLVSIFVGFFGEKTEENRALSHSKPVPHCQVKPCALHPEMLELFSVIKYLLCRPSPIVTHYVFYTWYLQYLSQIIQVTPVLALTRPHDKTPPMSITVHYRAYRTNINKVIKYASSLVDFGTKCLM